jgi:DNA-binding XRE family transcriptional regulator
MTEITTPATRAKKAHSLVLQRLAAATQTAVAAAMGTSESTINRIKTERLEEALLMLAHLGLKVVPADFKCVNAEAYAFLTTTHERVMREAPHLIWDIEE